MAIDVRDDNGDVVVETRPVWKKRRYLVVLLAFFGFINIYTLRYFEIQTNIKPSCFFTNYRMKSHLLPLMLLNQTFRSKVRNTNHNLQLPIYNIFLSRINLSVGIVAMTENRTIEHANGTVSYEQYFDWDSKQQGLILSSFFYGYICTQVRFDLIEL